MSRDRVRVRPGHTNLVRPCPCRGAERERVACPTCAGRVEVKVLSCLLRGGCTLEKALPGRACCADCPDHPRDSSAG